MVSAQLNKAELEHQLLPPPLMTTWDSKPTTANAATDDKFSSLKKYTNRNPQELQSFPPLKTCASPRLPLPKRDSKATTKSRLKHNRNPLYEPIRNISEWEKLQQQLLPPLKTCASPPLPKRDSKATTKDLSRLKHHRNPLCEQIRNTCQWQELQHQYLPPLKTCASPLMICKNTKANGNQVLKPIENFSQWKAAIMMRKKKNTNSVLDFNYTGDDVEQQSR